MAPDLSHCPFCGQPLASKAAIKHLHTSEAKFERKLRRSVLDEATAEAEEKVHSKLERQQTNERRQLERSVRRLREQKSELERQLESLNAPERGDLNEEAIFARLVEAFPEDDIKRKGQTGDIIQVVRYSTGRVQQEAGLMLYECKDTRRWSNSYIEQIKADGKTRRTRHLLLVTRAMPAGATGMCISDGVVVVDVDHVVYLAHVIRQMLIETHRAGLAGKGKAAKTARLYEYLASDDFREHFDAVIETGAKLTAMLQAERRAHERTWTRREQTYSQLERKSVAINEAIRSIIEAEPPPSALHKSAKRPPKRARSGRGHQPVHGAAR